MVLVGLPARGKSFVSNKIAGWFRWRGIPCRPVNVGALRRKQVTAPQDASFFSASNDAAKTERERVAMQALHQALGWLLEDAASAAPRVAIFDATNTTRARRATLLQQTATFADSLGVAPPAVLFLELICNVEATITSNCLQKCLNSHDYRDMPLDVAMADLRRRIAEYERVYETLDEALEDPLAPPSMSPISYIQSIDLQSKLICRNVAGALPMAVVSLLMAVHLVARPIYLVRAGQCTDDDVRARIRQSEALRMAQAAAAATAGAGAGHSDDAVGLTLTDDAQAKATAGAGAGPGPDSASGASAASAASGSSLSQPSMAALTTALTLNDNGQLFARQLARFVLRRTAGGQYTVVPDDSPSPAAAASAVTTGSSSVDASVAAVSAAVAPAAESEATAAPSPPSPAAPAPVLSFGPAATAASSPARSPPQTHLHSGGSGPASVSSSAGGHRASGAKLVLRSSFCSRGASFGDGLAEAPGFLVSLSDRQEGADGGYGAVAARPTSGSIGGSLPSTARPSATGGEAAGGMRRVPSVGGGLLIRAIALQAPPLPMRVRVADVSGVGAAAHATAGGGTMAGSLTAASAEAWTDGHGDSTPTALTASTAVSEGATPVGARAAAFSMVKESTSAAAEPPPVAASLLGGSAAAGAAVAGPAHAAASFASAGDLLSYGSAVLPGAGMLVPADADFDTDETDGVLASAPVLAQNDHYKRESQNQSAAPRASSDGAVILVASSNAGPAGTASGASGDDGPKDADADAAPLEVFDAQPVVFTSTLPRTIQMAAALPFRSQQMSALNPMDTGAFRVPIQFLRTASPLGALVYDRWRSAPDRAHARIEGGESLADVVTRLAPFVLELERCRRPTVVISHLSTLQVLLAYFKGVPVADCVDLDFPMACVIELRPHQVRSLANHGINEHNSACVAATRYRLLHSLSFFHACAHAVRLARATLHLHAGQQRRQHHFFLILNGIKGGLDRRRHRQWKEC